MILKQEATQSLEFEKNINLGGNGMYNVVYVAMCNGVIKYASTEKDNANDYAYNQNVNARQEVLDEWENDDPTEEDIAEAAFQAGFDGEFYEVVKVDISNKTDDDTIELPDGTEVEVAEIKEALRKYQ